MMPELKKKHLFVTGLSGAGMSSALKALEDIGYEVFDNFPLSLVGPLMEQTDHNAVPLALGIDLRARGFDPQALLSLKETHQAELLFMEADESVLLQRFSETRRRHPLAKDRPVIEGIKSEQVILQMLRPESALIIDTSALSIHDLKRTLLAHFGFDNKKELNVTVLSFGFKHGLPRNADIVMDIRFLKNPHWETSLRPLTGLDQDVQHYIKEDENLGPFQEKFKDLLSSLLPLYLKEGKTYLTIAIGCTGGQHRSVYVSESFAEWINNSLDAKAHTRHRDIAIKKAT